jgi:quercetin dioxygenase-like cupin family protein
MLVNRTTGRDWKPTDYAGIERALFRNNPEGGRSSFLRMKAGTRFPAHRHTGTEEVIVIAGRVRLGKVELHEGDYLFTEPGEEHDVEALTDVVLFVSSQKATPLVEQSAR